MADIMVTVELDQFDDEEILAYAEELGLNDHFRELATRSLELFKQKKDADAINVARDLIEKITGRII